MLQRAKGKGGPAGACKKARRPWTIRRRAFDYRGRATAICGRGRGGRSFGAVGVLAFPWRDPVLGVGSDQRMA
jgi:hypothetical protein